MEHQDDELHSLRDQLRLHIDAAAKSAAAVLQTATDLLLAMAARESPVAPDAVQTESVSTPAVMTPEQAAEYLGVATQTLAVWRSTGRCALPFVKVGRNARYRKPFGAFQGLRRCFVRLTDTNRGTGSAHGPQRDPLAVVELMPWRPTQAARSAHPTPRAPLSTRHCPSA